jgi:hypothetical protein
MSLPYEVQRRGMAKWDGNVCIKFASLFLECKGSGSLMQCAPTDTDFDVRAPPQHQG